MRRLTGRTHVPALSLGCAVRPIVPVVSRRCGGIGCRKAIVRGCSIGRRRDACARREKRSEKPKRREGSLDCRRHDLAHPLTDASQLCANSSNQTLTPWMAARPSAWVATRPSHRSGGELLVERFEPPCQVSTQAVTAAGQHALRRACHGSSSASGWGPAVKRPAIGLAWHDMSVVGAHSDTDR